MTKALQENLVWQKSLNANLFRWVIVLVLLSFAHRLFESEWAWEIGWVIHDFTEIILSYYLFRYIDNKSIIVKSCVLIYMVLSINMGLLNTFNVLGWYFSLDLTAICYFTIFFNILPLICIYKQATGIPIIATPDKYNPENYMIGLLPIETGWGVANFARAANRVMYGGRCIVAGDDVWRSRGSVFIKAKADYNSLKEKYIFFDTGVPISKEINRKLDKVVGTLLFPILNDCRLLDVGINVNKLVREKNARERVHKANS